MKHRMGSSMRFLLQFLFSVDTIWKGDLFLYGMSICNGYNSQVSIAYKSLRDGGFITEYEPVYPSSRSMYSVRRKKTGEDNISEKLKPVLFKKLESTIRSPYILVSISQKGINWLVDHEEEHHGYYYQHRNKELRERFRTTDQDRIIRQLMKSRAMAVMSAADTSTFPNEKPSMYRLHGIINNGAGGEYSDEVDQEYFPQYLKMDREECIDLLNTKGIFYTNDEVLEATNLLVTGRADTFRGSRFYGVYLSNMTAFVLYQERPGDDRQIKIKEGFETRLRETINMFFESELGYKRKVPYKDATTGLYTAILSDGDSMMYTLSTQVKHGRLFLSEDEKNDPEKISGRLAEIEKKSDYVQILGRNAKMYPRVFVMPVSNAGTLSMNYLCHHSVTDYFRDSADLIKARPDLFTPSTTMLDPFVFGWENEKFRNANRFVVFMPVYEINLVRQLATGAEDPENAPEYGIITLPLLADAISHGVRKHCRYYDITTLDRIWIDAETKHTVTYSLQDMNIIKDLMQANKLLGNGEYWTLDQLKAIQNNPTLNSDVIQVIQDNPASDDKKKKLPMKIAEYGVDGIAKNGRDKYAALRQSESGEEKNNQKRTSSNKNRVRVLMSYEDKAALKKAANTLDISLSEFVKRYAMPEAYRIIELEKQKKHEERMNIKNSVNENRQN